jgi:diguanylate cyclase (GGDEF)-like protein
MNFLRSITFRLFALSAAIVGVLSFTVALLAGISRQEERLRVQETEQVRRLDQFHAVRHALSSVRLLEAGLDATAASGEGERGFEAGSSLAEARTGLERELAALEAFAPQAVRAVRDGLEPPPGAREAVVSMESELARAENDVSRALAQQREAARLSAARGLRAAMYSTAATLALGLILALTVRRNLVRPLRRIVAAIRGMTAGDAHVALPAALPDEFGDLTAALKQFQDQAEKLKVIAYRDPLTGLANRARLEEALHAGIVKCARGSKSLALLFLDLDNFKSVNDSLGHSTGDQFLREAARRLQRLVPDTAVISRYSGDKFTVVVESLRRDGAQHEELRTLAGAIVRGMAEPYRNGEDFLYMTASIGIAVYPMDGQSPEQIVSAADAAMYLAKRSGRNTLQFASPDLTEDARRKLLLAGEIRRGLAAGEFQPYYQPIVDVRSGNVAGAEALLRWHHPQRGIVMPGEFIRVAEDCGIIGDLGERCLTMAYEQAVRWSSKGSETPISVNLSARQLQDRKVLSVVQQLQAAQELRPHCLEFEITESAVMERPDLSQQTLQEIRQRGHKIGIDDFGTGHSALGYLQRFPIDRIKIDRSFVERVDTSRQSRAIISATLALAENLGLDVVAEGVESQSQLTHMRELGCPLHQGYFFTPALPANEFEAWMAAR